MRSFVRWLRRLSRPTAAVRNRRSAATPRPGLEWLEERRVPTLYVVNTTNDVLGDTTPNEVTLRDALTAISTHAASGNAPAGSATNTIDFAIGATGTSQEIDVGSGNVAAPLPALTHEATIDGWSQGGAGYTGAPLIVLNGAAAGAGATGLEFDAGSNDSTARGLVIQQFGGDGIDIFGASGTLIVGNYVGTDVSGAEASANGGDGIFVGAGAAHATVGGTAAAARNVISGNSFNGVELSDSSSALVAGNFIGTDVSGTANLGNVGDGIAIDSGAARNTVGGSVAGAGNVVSGNQLHGVEVTGVGSSGNLLLGNFIGLAAGGSSPLGNSSDGVAVEAKATANTVGGTAPGAANVISSNGEQGVLLSDAGTSGNVILGNRIGTNVGGTLGAGNGANGVLILDSANGNTVGAGNLISANQNNGVEIDGSSGNVVQGDLIGTDGGGTSGLGNTFSGVLLGAGATANTVGGTTPALGDVISGNQIDGVDVTGTGTSRNVVEGNLIGTDIHGTGRLANSNDGVFIALAATANTVGGPSVSAGNIISGNGADGVFLSDAGTSRNQLLFNLIGLAKGGSNGLDNANDGVLIAFSANGNTVGAGNVISSNANNGVEIASSANVVLGCLIGTDVTGTLGRGNSSNGVALLNAATNNTIGGTARGAGNVISGNGLGVNITTAGTSGNVVQGNLIGTNKAGTARLGNSIYGVAVSFGATGNTVGGAAAGAGNVISGNFSSGVEITGANANAVQGNLIGTDKGGTASLGNGGEGVLISFGATGNTVGGTTPGTGNAIAFNFKGVVIIENTTTGDRILGNRIFGNLSLGIDLGDDGATPNGANPRAFPNNGQNTPVIKSLTATSASGMLSSRPLTTFRLEFFATRAAGSPSQGQTFLGFVNVKTGASGTVAFTAPLAAIPSGSVVTSTATDLTTGDTSEFSVVGTQLVLLSNPSVPFSGSTQKVQLTAQLFAGNTPQTGAKVTFRIAGVAGPVVGTVNAQGFATVSVTLPAGLPAGDYLITASYAGDGGLVSQGELSVEAPAGLVGRRYKR